MNSKQLEKTQKHHYKNEQQPYYETTTLTTNKLSIILIGKKLQCIFLFYR